MNPYACTYMYIYAVTQHEKCHRYNMHLFMILKVHLVIHVHDFKCTLKMVYTTKHSKVVV